MRQWGYIKVDLNPDNYNHWGNILKSEYDNNDIRYWAMFCTKDLIYIIINFDLPYSAGVPMITITYVHAYQYIRDAKAHIPFTFASSVMRNHDNNEQPLYLIKFGYNKYHHKSHLWPIDTICAYYAGDSATKIKIKAEQDKIYKKLVSSINIDKPNSKTYIPFIKVQIADETPYLAGVSDSIKYIPWLRDSNYTDEWLNITP